MDSMKVYNESVGHSHEVAVAAVYKSGFEDGYRKAVDDTKYDISKDEVTVEQDDQESDHEPEAAAVSTEEVTETTQTQGGENGHDGQ